MISVITCSVDPCASKRLYKNIAATIGVPFEYIPFDNRTERRGLCDVYNMYAENAAYDVLCFVHEDIMFHTQDWGETVIRQVMAPGCGVIGFAGSAFKPQAYSGWNTGISHYKRINLIEGYEGDSRKVTVNPTGAPFSEVITLDGLCLFVNKDVWRQTKFDSQTFSGFHCYDIDFSATVSLRHTNYVCNCIEIQHFSTGRCDSSWYGEIVRFHEKWSEKLPLYINRPDAKQRVKDEVQAWMSFIMWMVHGRICTDREIRDLIRHCLRKYPFSINLWKTALYYAVNRIPIFHRQNG